MERPRTERSTLWWTRPSTWRQVSKTIDGMFQNTERPTKTETEKAFGLDFVNQLGNVKLFILSICGAVVFAILLVSGKHHGHDHSRAHP